MNNNEIVNVNDALRQYIDNRIQAALDALPVSLPCKVLSREKVTVSVAPVITFGELTPPRIDNVPIMKSKYFNEPVKAGDFGILLPVSYFYQSIVTDDASQVQDLVPSSFMSNFVFLPLSQNGTELSDGIETSIFAKGGSTNILVKNDAIELNGNTGFATEWTALNTAFQTFVGAVNTALAAKLDGGGTAGTLTLDLANSKVADVKVSV